jgi:V8-like Glu-specific endopeptidase
MIIPEKASLFIYTPDRKTVMGSFTSENEQSSGYFSCYPLPGDEIVVEYNVPEEVKYKGQIHIFKVNHDYKNVFGTRPLGESGTCNRDVYCPDVIAYSKEKQSVVDLIIAGHELCTGTLINNVRQDKTPYMITAGHCIADASEAQQTLICFNYESPYCGNGKSSLNGYADQTLSGSILKSRSDSLDFALVQLETVPPAEFRPFYAGWNRSGAIPSSSFSIHHPLGDVKKISFDNNPPTIGNFSNEFVSNSFWIIGKWEAGTTEAGSSGGPLFSDKKLLIGSLTGGTSTCTDPTDDLFSMFSKQWNHYSASGMQLKAWLDPDNTGAQEIPSINPYDTAVSCDLFSNMEPGEGYSLKKISNSSGGYTTGHNYLKIKNYAERFQQTKQTVLSAVSIGVAKAISPVDNSHSIITMQIFQEDTVSGIPGGELVSMNVPLSVLSAQKMNFISLDNPILIKGKYFVGYQIDYTNQADTFAVYQSSDRNKVDQNKAYAIDNGFWKPFYAVPGIEQPASLLIDSHGCESVLAEGGNPNPGSEINKFQVLYPQTGISDYIYLKNKGTDEYVRINLYDLSGKKLFIKQQNVTSSPQMISLENYSSGIYFLTVEATGGTQVIKIRINRQK